MIELKDVSFTYESGETENNLSHINLAIQDVGAGQIRERDGTPRRQR